MHVGMCQLAPVTCCSHQLPGVRAPLVQRLGGGVEAGASCTGQATHLHTGDNLWQNAAHHTQLRACGTGNHPGGEGATWAELPVVQAPCRGRLPAAWQFNSMAEPACWDTCAEGAATAVAGHLHTPAQAGSPQRPASPGGRCQGCGLAITQHCANGSTAAELQSAQAPTAGG